MYLLGIDKKYCFEPEALSDKDQFVSNKEVAWVTLNIRSNLYDDNVEINGVNYGSTPVEVMLPVGPHMITVQKEGYRSFHRELTVRRDQNLRAVLVEKENPLREGDKFADSLALVIKALSCPLFYQASTFLVNMAQSNFS